MRSLPDPGFADDDGAADPAVAAALAVYADDRSSGPVLAALVRSRLLVPVVAVATEVALDDAGRAHDKVADIAAVMQRGVDGRTGLLVFTGLTTLRAWNPEARPVPTTTRDAARAALEASGAALLVDLAGPVRFVVETADLRRLASGHLLVRTDVGYGWVGDG